MKRKRNKIKVLADIVGLPESTVRGACENIKRSRGAADMEEMAKHHPNVKIALDKLKEMRVNQVQKENEGLRKSIIGFIIDSGFEISMPGSYNPSLEVIELAAKEWVETGSSPMREHMKLTHIRWDGGSIDVDTVELLDRLIRLETFWHWSNWFNDIEEIEFIRDRIQCKLDCHESYGSRRKVANSVISNKALRESVFSRDGYKCCHCGSKEKLSIDHVEPVLLGGSNNLSNLQTLCIFCNSSKGAKYELD